jgi:hypothetical protein
MEINMLKYLTAEELKECKNKNLPLKMKDSVFAKQDYKINEFYIVEITILFPRLCQWPVYTVNFKNVDSNAISTFFLMDDKTASNLYCDQPAIVINNYCNCNNRKCKKVFISNSLQYDFCDNCKKEIK